MDTKIGEAIKCIAGLAAEKTPVVIRVYESGDKNSGFSTFYRKTQGPVFPEKEIKLNLTEKEAKELMKKLEVKERYAYIVEDYGPGHDEYHWWSPTNIPGAIWHHATWSWEEVGADSTLIIVGLLPGACEDLKMVLDQAEEALLKFSCKDISNLAKNEMQRVLGESDNRLEYIGALIEKAKKLNASEEKISQLEEVFDHKKVEQLIMHQMPWRVEVGHISDLKKYIDEVIDISEKLQKRLPNEMLDYVLIYSDSIISEYEKTLKENRDPFQAYFASNCKEYKKNTKIITDTLNELKYFVTLTKNVQLARRYDTVIKELLCRWSKRGKKLCSPQGKFIYWMKNSWIGDFISLLDILK